VKTLAERTAEHRARRIETIVRTLVKRCPTLADPVSHATAIENQLHPPEWAGNPNGRDDLVLTHYFRCSVTGRHFSVTVQGAFFENERTARELVAEQLVRLDALQTTDPEDALTIEGALSRLEPLHTVKVERVVAVKPFSRDTKALESIERRAIELRSQVVTP